MHELGDYDNVLGYLEQRGAGAESTNERKGSYADLQRLRNESRERLGLNGATALPAPSVAVAGSDSSSVRTGRECVDSAEPIDGIQLRRRTDGKAGALDDS